MSALGSLSQGNQQLLQDLQNELTTANQLLRLISLELEQIKTFTNPAGDFAANIQKNAELMKKLANLQQVDLTKLPPFTRKYIDLNENANQNVSYEEHNTFRNESEMDESQ
ncbi:unnamed protein product [Spodoptera littoralis]|uniref:Uncharacterized protein n=1 Tax=Spodoptera littoralis TaxID=7109 RepID=A0A9P0N430_SPOLI|nr:unnamed protein product [Spodoptera littoralis]CAH1639129.1 unnamed protein product [Spodoptera littoralis]